jgi:hypothetical protein|tara:strand:- start:191 stop:409 length:219 start_codon:yes stop_codon:yes gene_type:complete
MNLILQKNAPTSGFNRGKLLQKETAVVIVDENDKEIYTVTQNINPEGGPLYDENEYNQYDAIEFSDTEYWYI